MFRRISTGMLGALAAASLAMAPATAQYRGGGGGYQQHAGHHDDRRGYGDGYYRGGGGHRGYGNGYGYDDRGRAYGDGGYYGGRGRRRGYRDHCDRGTGGTIIGAIAGGLLGNTITGRGDHTVGTIAGAGVGALAGRAIDRDC